LARCRLCGRESPLISASVGVCLECLRSRPREAVEIAMEHHRRYRNMLGLPPEPPRDPKGVRCSLCINECSIPEDSVGFCGLWRNEGGMLVPVVKPGGAVFHAYYDPLPTNCVATPVCPAYTGAGYPKFAARPGTEYGYFNLAVFYAGCSLDCVFCQNWEHKDIVVSRYLRERYTETYDYLLKRALDDRVTCICYFGGDPGPQIQSALYVGRKLLEYSKRTGKVKRICWETNGLQNPKIMEQMALLSLESGGIVKIDWKAWTPSVYQALTGVDGWRAVERLKENVKLVAGMAGSRREIPLLVVSVLLVPGYVDAEEVRGIAEYVASIDDETPMVLLAFHPDHLMRDLPPTSRRHAEEAREAAKKAGIKRVFIGNEWLLGDYY